MPASRVLKKPGGNERQERKDAVSGRKDGNRGAGNTMARHQNRTEGRSSVFGGRPKRVDGQRESCSSYRLATVPLCQQLMWRSHVLDGTDNMQLSSPPRRYIQEGKPAKVVTVQLSNLGKPGDNGATPALDNMKQGIAHIEGLSVHCRSESNRTGSRSGRP